LRRTWAYESGFVGAAVAGVVAAPFAAPPGIRVRLFCIEVLHSAISPR